MLVLHLTFIFWHLRKTLTVFLPVSFFRLSATSGACPPPVYTVNLIMLSCEFHNFPATLKLLSCEYYVSLQDFDCCHVKLNCSREDYEHIFMGSRVNLVIHSSIKLLFCEHHTSQQDFNFIVHTQYF